MSLWQIILLAIIQGAAELLPVSSSAHVIAAQKLMGLDPTSPDMVFLLVMLHTGTMFAVILYFWSRWKAAFFASKAQALILIKKVFIATAITGVIGIALKEIIEKIFLRGYAKQEVEQLFGNLPMISIAIAAAGVVIFIGGQKRWVSSVKKEVDTTDSIWIGLIQGVCLPFRGFSRSGATISAALIRGVPQAIAEEFSFILAVVLTPPVILRSTLKLLKAHKAGELVNVHLSDSVIPGLLGMIFAFIAGWFALKFLSKMLEHGNWKFFGIYCFVVSFALLALHFNT